MRTGTRLMGIILILMVMIVVTGCGGAKDTNRKDIDYEVISQNDMSLGGAVRLSVDVVVNQDVSIEELERISKDVFSEIKKGISLNAISINFYDYKEYVGLGHTLGQTIYAPNGKWEDASTTSTGNYRYMEYDFNLKNKVWSNRLTKEEVSIFKSWHDLLSEGATEEDATKQISEKFSVSEDEVENVLTKQMLWALEDNK